MPSGEASANRITIGAKISQDERDGTPERTEEMMHAAQHRHQQGVAGVLPAQVIGVGTLQHERQQSAGISDDPRHDDERHELQPERVVAQALRALFVVAQRLQRPAERRVRDTPQQSDTQADGDDGEGME